MLLVEKEVYFELAYFNTPIQITDKLDFLLFATHNFMVLFSITSKNSKLQFIKPVKLSLKFFEPWLLRLFCMAVLVTLFPIPQSKPQ